LLNRSHQYDREILDRENSSRFAKSGSVAQGTLKNSVSWARRRASEDVEPFRQTYSDSRAFGNSVVLAKRCHWKPRLRGSWAKDDAETWAIRIPFSTHMAESLRIIAIL
jgi:hypothetical protein